MQGTSLSGEQDDSLAWFTRIHLNRVIKNGVTPEWFHGVLSRNLAEDQLTCSPRGCFLIRLSQTRAGFTLSYRGEDRCRHFMIDVNCDGLYNITGQSWYHSSLQDLVDFHHRLPIPPFNELLTCACVKTKQLAKTGTAPQFSLSATESTNAAHTPASNLACSPRLYPRLDTEVSTNVQRQNMPVRLPRGSCSPTSRHQGDVEAPVRPPEALVPGGGEELSAGNSGPSRQTPTPSQARPKRRIKLIHFIRKPHAKKCAVQERMYAEVSQESGNVVEDAALAALESRISAGWTGTENVYQELPGSPLSTGSGRRPANGPDLRPPSAEQQLPEEYLPPPPFAPGY